MLGQMALITVLFVCFGVYFFALRPLLSVEPSGMADPMDVTANQASQAISAFVFAERQKAGSGPSLANNPVLRQIKAKNPRFRYYAKVHDREYRDGMGTPFYISMGFDRLDRMALGKTYPGLCQSLAREVKEGTGRAFLAYYDCGERSYYEYAGIEHPVVSGADGSFQLYRKFIWSYGGGFLLTVGVAFVVFSLILVVNVVRIRRVAALAQSFDPEDLQGQLPEKGLPQEVLPLVSALNQTIRRLDESQRRKTFFLSAAAHEMRTPLTVLRTRLEVMDDGKLKDKLVSDVRRLINLVNQLLTLMTIGERAPPTMMIDLVTSTARAVSDREEMARRRGLDLLFEREPTSLPIPGDAGLIETAIGNLIDNALSFSAEGQSVRVRLDKHGWVHVRDQGPGVDMERVDDLFEPFVRQSTGRRGYGLGLAIVKAVVTLHRGKTLVVNGDQGGAIFSVSFSPARD